MPPIQSRTSPAPSVVCGVDSSAAAADAARVAARLADSLEVRLVLAHVPADPPPAAGARGPGGDWELQTPAPTETAPVSRVRAPWGEPAAGLCQVAEDENAVLLVTGSRGHGMLTSALLGSVSQSLAGRARVPVVIVAPGSRGDWT